MSDVLNSLAAEAAAARRQTLGDGSPPKKRRIEKVSQRIPVPNFPTHGDLHHQDPQAEDRFQHSNAQLLKRLNQLEENQASQIDYKRKYEELQQLQQSSGHSTIVPTEPLPAASLVEGTWQEAGKQPVKLKDDGHKRLDMMGFRLKLRPVSPNKVII